MITFHINFFRIAPKVNLSPSAHRPKLPSSDFVIKMKVSITGILTSVLAASRVQALPQPHSLVADDLALVDRSPSPNGTENTGLQRRADVDTEVEIGGGRVAAQDLNIQPPKHPAAFTELFDYLDGTICTDLGCDTSAEHCVTAAAGGEQVCISASGTWLRDQRNDFISSARGIFDRSVQYSGSDSGVFETGTDLIGLVAKRGRNSGYNIRVMLRNRNVGSGQCGNTVDTIAQGGSQIPEVGAVFGLVGFFCNSIQRFSGQATG